MKKTAQTPKTTCPDCRANCRKPVQRKTIQKLAPWFFSILLICLLMQPAFAAAYALDTPNAQEPSIESTDPICRIDDQAALLTNEQREKLYTEGGTHCPNIQLRPLPADAGRFQSTVWRCRCIRRGGFVLPCQSAWLRRGPRWFAAGAQYVGPGLWPLPLWPVGGYGFHGGCPDGCGKRLFG